MNNHHKTGEDKTPLKDSLDEISQAYGRMGHEEPPEMLDQAILNSARRAVEKKSRWTQFGWLHGVTTAAVFVLAFSIILNQREPALDYENTVMSPEPTLLKSEKATRSKAAPQLNEVRMEMKEQTEYRSADVQALEVSAEEIQLGDADLGDTDSMANAPESAVHSEQAGFMAVAEPAKSTTADEAESTSGAEQKLATIIRLKQAGDDAWKKELEIFQQQYPEYPLPDELKD